MSDKKNIHSADDNKNPQEIPDNPPPSEIEPIKATGAGKARMERKMKGIKLAYAFSLLLVLGAVLTARLVAEQSAGSLSPIESDYVSFPKEEITFPLSDDDYEVRQNVTNAPDIREETELSTEAETEKVTEEESLPFAIPYKDYFNLPLGTEILKDYSPTVPSYNPTLNDWRTHGGIDFQAPDGSQVKAIAYGTVTEIAEDPLYGTVIVIDHGNQVIAKYCGMNKDALEVSAGDTVKSGSLLGYLGTVPCEKSELSHLHFEIFYKGERVDPLALMNKQ